MTDFGSVESLKKTPYISTLFGREIILDCLAVYDGPITLQYLPPGGIQSVYGGNFIITTALGFIKAGRIVYGGREYRSGEFTALYQNLVNQVLPN